MAKNSVIDDILFIDINNYVILSIFITLLLRIKYFPKKF